MPALPLHPLADAADPGWQAVQIVVIVLYVAAPLVVLAAGVWQRRRSDKKAISGAVTTWAAGFVLGGGLALAYGFFIAGSVAATPVTQVLLAGYFATALLAILKGADAVVRFVMTHVTDFFTSRNSGPFARRSWRATATFTRFMTLACVGLPIVMASVMTYRIKVLPVATPAGVEGVTWEAVRFETSDGIELAAWWMPAQRSPGAGPTPGESVTLLIVPGLGSGKADLLSVAEFFRSQRLNILIFDPRAHGSSGGQLSSFGADEQRDVLAAVDWLRANQPDASRQIYGLGMSMGGAALVAAASREDRPFQAIAVVDTYDDLDLLADKIIGQQFESAPPVRWAARLIALPLASAYTGRSLSSFRPADYAANLFPTPILVAHSTGDNLIPFDAGRRLFRAAEEPKESLWVERYDHDAAMTAPEVLEGVSAFFRRAADWRPLVLLDDPPEATPSSTPPSRPLPSS